MSTYAALLADSTPRYLDPNVVRPGWLALGIVALLGVALVLLLWNFSKQLKKVTFTEDTSVPEGKAPRRGPRERP